MRRPQAARTHSLLTRRRELRERPARLSRAIDALNERIGRIVYWLVLAAVLISAANAIVRKAFDMSSQRYLEIQWYLFSAVFLLCAGYTLLHNEHIRIDIISGALLAAHADVDRHLRHALLPAADGGADPVRVVAVVRARPAYSGEVSASAGGLILWPAKLLVPVGFVLLGLQGISELIKRIAFLRGLGPDPTRRSSTKTAEEELAEEILRLRELEQPHDRAGPPRARITPQRAARRDFQ